MEKAVEVVSNFVFIDPAKNLQEMLRIFPDGLILGVGFFALLTFSFPYFIFFLSLIESLLVFHGLRSLNSYLDIARITPTQDAAGLKCRTGFSSVTLDSLSLFGNGPRFGFPSAPVYSLTVAASYIYGSMYRYRKELEVLGSEYSSRFYIATIALPILLVIFSLHRLYNNCDELGNLLVTILFGILLGFVLVLQNERIFGHGSTNLLGVPRLRAKTVDGKPIYVCPK